jgi:hypothetical protein
VPLGRERESNAAASLAARLRAAKRRAFVGREAELELFRTALAAETPPFTVLYVHGPGGIGKSALLDAFAGLAEDAGLAVARLDARELDRAPEALRAAVLGPERGDGAPRRVVLVDAYEALAPLDGWVRDVLLPELPATTVVVLAARDAPAAGWRTDAGWGELFRSVALRNLRPDESRALLERRGVPAARAAEVMGFTYGHPLALTLVADVLAQSEAGLTPERSLDVVRALVQRFTEGVPSERHREALEVCAHARVTTEALLGAALGPDHAHALFEWLASLSFVEGGPQGLHLHDLAREALDDDLRWRNFEAWTALHRRIRAHVVSRIGAAPGARERQRAVTDLLFLHRHNPVSRPILRFYELGRVVAEPMRPEEAPALAEIAERVHGPEAAGRVGHWLARQPESAWVIVDGPRRPAGFFLDLRLDRASPEDLAADPVARLAWEHVRRRGPLREGEVANLGRLWLDAEQGRALQTSAIEMAATVSSLRWLGTPSLAWSFVMGDPDTGFPAFMEHCDFARVPCGDVAEDGRACALFAHDWRVRSPAAWLELMADREIGVGDEDAMATPAARSAPTPLVLSQPEFDDAVRRALRDLHRPDALRESPLLRSRVVLERADSAGAPAALRALLRDETEALRADPRAAKLHRAVHRTYLEPAPTQERAAELLRLPFSTYRRHLGAGVERIVARLWRRELYGEGFEDG